MRYGGLLIIPGTGGHLSVVRVIRQSLVAFSIPWRPPLPALRWDRIPTSVFPVMYPILPRLPALFAVAVLGLTATARAGLEFEKTDRSADVKPGDVKVAVSFPFRITGDQEVTIKDIRTFCSCLKARPTDGKMVWKPGESGALETEFEVGAFEGRLRKQIALTTSDAAAPQTTLNVDLTIPALFEIKPDQVLWLVGEEPTVKTVRITVLGADPVHITGAVPSRNNITAAVREVEPGKIYELDVKPETTANAMLGLVSVRTDSNIPRLQKRLIFFNISRKKPGAPDSAAGAPPKTQPGPPPAAPAAAPAEVSKPEAPRQP